jgi:anti-sigma regulatory factor (Ser/Thr protein kinase)
MPSRKERAQQIREFILSNLTSNPTDISAVAAAHFGVSRQSISRHLRYLVEQGFLISSGRTRDRKYELKSITEDSFTCEVKGLEEDTVWRQRILPHLSVVPQNVISLMDYGFTEMLNNVIDHSGSKEVHINLARYPMNTQITLRDMGVGIFNKIQRTLGLENPRHALLELSKGKLTTDPTSHTGEGIFFSSRMFDIFSILSGETGFVQRYGEEGWTMDTPEETYVQGTFVLMRINDMAAHTIQQVFERYTQSGDDFTFNRTHVALRLAKHEGENLISRSQAKRILARADQFEEIALDFSDIDYIGPSFADEIFRVFANQHPEVLLIPVETSGQVNRAIQRARSRAPDNTEESDPVQN